MCVYPQCGEGSHRDLKMQDDDSFTHINMWNKDCTNTETIYLFCYRYNIM